MPRKLAKGRIAGLTMAVTALVSSVGFLLEARRLDSEFQSWQTALPLDAAVDFSTPGETVTRFHQTCDSSHGQVIYLRVTPPPQGEVEAASVLEGLSATLTIRAEGGLLLHEEPMVSLRGSSYAPQDGLLIGAFKPFLKGDFDAIVTVRSGAAALAGREQRLVARYALCGLEQLPTLLAGAASFSTGVIGVLLVAVILPRLCRQGLWRESAGGQLAGMTPGQAPPSSME